MMIFELNLLNISGSIYKNGRKKWILESVWIAGLKRQLPYITKKFSILLNSKLLFKKIHFNTKSKSKFKVFSSLMEDVLPGWPPSFSISGYTGPCGTEAPSDL